MKKLTTEIFIEKSNLFHNNIYDYSKVVYEGECIPVIIICSLHDEFYQKPIHHFRGQGYPKCGLIKSGSSQRMPFEEFVQKCNIVHDDKYEYLEYKYHGKRKNIVFVCKIHGKFEQNAFCHLNGHNCPKCALESRKLLISEFIERGNAIHGNKFDYSKVVYVKNSVKVIIICPKHGEYKQYPSAH